MRKIVGILILYFCSLNFIWAQDYTFSNHNIVPFSLNPALAGNANALRLGLNYRHQWPSLGNAYRTVRASYDQNVYKQMSSIGVAYSYDNMANGIYKTNEFDLVYSHTFRVRESMFVRLGLQAALFANYLDWGNFTFEDQYDTYTKKILPNSIEDLETDNRLFPDFTFGACFVIENKLSLGVSVCHMAEPYNGFAKLEDNKLSRKYVAHASFTQNLEGERGLFGRQGFLADKHLFFNASYQKQDNFEMAYLGGGLAINPFIVGGSFKSDISEVNTVSLMLGGNYKGFQLYYIYDFFTSSKKNGSWSHEISLIYILPMEEKPYSCPVIYW